MSGKIPGFPVVISSPSGGGKTTVCGRLVKQLKAAERIITCTTRAPRLGEKPGRSYNFWTEARFLRAVKDDQMAEWAKVHMHYYGIPRRQLEAAVKKGKIPVLVIDIQGAQTIKRKYPQSVLIFLLAPSWKELRARLVGRKDNTADVELRLKTAKHELAALPKYDYAVINDKLRDAVKQVACIIETERLRASRQIKRMVLNKGGYSFK